MPDKSYQLEYSKLDPTLLNVSTREIKAKKNMVVLRDFCGSVGEMDLLDVSSSTGIMTRYYSAEFRSVLGIDIDRPAMLHAQAHRSAANLTYALSDAMQMPLRDAYFDVVTCTQVYEHVSDAQRMLDEIFRVLKPGGVCLFGATNRLNVIENQYGKLPFLSIIPKPLAHVYLRILGRARFYYETHYTLWGLRRLVRRFEVIDYTAAIVNDPERFEATDMIRPGTLAQRGAKTLVTRAYWLFPGYIWILKKLRRIHEFLVERE